MHLHFYSIASTLSEIKNNHIVMSNAVNPIANNDMIEVVHTNNKRLSNSEYHEQMTIQYNKLPKNLQAMVSLEYFIEQSKSKRSQIETQLHDHVSTSDQILFDNSFFTQIFTMDLHQSNTHFNLWQHKADNFKGIIITFNTESLSKGTFQKQTQLRLLKPINYTQDKLVNKSKESPLPGIFDMPIELSLEKGWRLAIPSKHCYALKSGEKILKLKKSDITSITFGCYFDEKIKKETMKYFKNDLNLKHIQFQQLYTSKRHFEFTVRPLKN